MKKLMSKTRLRVKVQPKSSRDCVSGRFGDAVKISLQAPPTDGMANQALIDFLADCLDLPKRAIRIVSGHTNRLKTLEIDDLSIDEINRRLKV